MRKMSHDAGYHMMQDITTPMILHAADSQISKDFTYRKEYPAVQLTTNLSDKN